MNKTEIGLFVAEKMGLDIKDQKVIDSAVMAMESFFSKIATDLAKEKKVAIPKFGRFYLTEIRNRSFTNPKTGKVIVKDKYFKVGFSPRKYINNSLGRRG